MDKPLKAHISPLQILAASLFTLRFGAAMTAVGLPLLVLHRYGAGWHAGFTLALEILPNVLFGPIVGAMIDHSDPRRFAIGGSVLAAPGLALLPAADSLGTVVFYAQTQTRLPREFQGRFFGMLISASDACLMLGTTTAGVVVATGVTAAAWIVAAAMVVPVIVVWPLLADRPGYVANRAMWVVGPDPPGPAQPPRPARRPSRTGRRE